MIRSTTVTIYNLKIRLFILVLSYIGLAMPVKSEFEAVAVATQPFSKTFLDAIWKHFVQDPTRPALVNANDESDRVTYGELYLYCHAVATFLEARRFGHRDTVCLALPNSWQFLAALMGTAILGGTVSPASHTFTQYELERQFADCQCQVVFCSNNNFPQVYNAAQNAPRITTIVVMKDERVAERGVLPTATGNIELFHFEDLLADSQPRALTHKKVEIHVEKDILLLPYSSGTTGAPKGVMLSHSNVGTMCAIQDNHFKKELLPYLVPSYDYCQEHYFTILPFYHNYGLLMSVTTVINGATLLFTRGRFDAHIFCATIQKYRIRFLMLVPPLLLFMVKSPVVDQYDLSSVLFIMTGAAPAGRDLCIELRNKYSNLVSVAQAYGMTELCLASLFPCLKNGKERYESSGKLISNFEMKIVDVERGVEVDEGEPGELYFRSPTVMIGYLGRPGATAEAIDEEGWLRSGDIGIMDRDGFIRIVDRRKELIKVKGYQVPPAELEDLLLTHPRVSDCAVIGVPDGNSGELPKAFVVRADPRLSESDVRAFVKERAAHYKQLKGGVEFVEEIPKSAAGKILRRALRQPSKNVGMNLSQ